MKHVLRGLDGAVLQSYRGGEGTENQAKGATSLTSKGQKKAMDDNDNHRK